jgi:hypothetical protein
MLVGMIFIQHGCSHIEHCAPPHDSTYVCVCLCVCVCSCVLVFLCVCVCVCVCVWVCGGVCGCVCVCVCVHRAFRIAARFDLQTVQLL